MLRVLGIFFVLWVGEAMASSGLPVAKVTYRTLTEKWIQFLVRGTESAFADPATRCHVPGANDNKQECSTSRVLDEHANAFLLKFPGSVWCGVTSNGSGDKTDQCCYYHSECIPQMSPGHDLATIVNNGIFTRYSCQCESEFYQCLQEAKTVKAYLTGHTYFNVLKLQCFDYRHPIRGCRRKGPYHGFKRRCLEYEYDETRPEVYQWFDVGNFYP